MPVQVKKRNTPGQFFNKDIQHSQVAGCFFPPTLLQRGKMICLLKMQFWHFFLHISPLQQRYHTFKWKTKTNNKQPKYDLDTAPWPVPWAVLEDHKNNVEGTQIPAQVCSKPEEQFSQWHWKVKEEIYSNDQEYTQRADLHYLLTGVLEHYNFKPQCFKIKYFSSWRFLAIRTPLNSLNLQKYIPTSKMMFPNSYKWKQC